jgi:uncharacterized membrane protein
MSFILGMLFGAALLGLVFILSMKGIALRWYEWLLGALGLILGLWAVHDFFASMAEHNESAARFLLWVIGTPALILLVLAVFLPWWRISHSAKTDSQSPTGV